MRQASLGDLLKHSPQKYAAASSKIEMMGQINMIFSPMISAWLVSRGIRLPWIVASVVYVFTVPACMYLVQETLPLADRRPFSVADFTRRANPLTFLSLFTKGPKLRALAILEMVRWRSPSAHFCFAHILLSFAPFCPLFALSSVQCLLAWLVRSGRCATAVPRGRSATCTGSRCWTGTSRRADGSCLSPRSSPSADTVRERVVAPF